MKLAVASVSGCVALGMAELGVRVLYPSSERYAVLVPNLDVTLEPAPGILPGVSGRSRYRVNGDGIRGRNFGLRASEYRILALGGSTTECLYLDDSEAWTTLLEDALPAPGGQRRVWVGNVGKAGTTSRDHVVQLKFLSAQHPLDAVIVLVGINDLTRALAAGDGYERPEPITDPAAERQQMRRAFALVPGRLHEPGTDYLRAADAAWYKSTALWQLLRRIKDNLSVRLEGTVQDDAALIYARWRAHRQGASALLDALPDLTGPLEEYRANLHAMADVAGQRGLRLVFVTQPVLWREDLTAEERALLWLGGTGDFQVEPGQTYYTPGALRRAMDLFNGALLEVCTARQLECIDAAGGLPADAALFYDDVHFTEAGARALAALIAHALRETPPFDTDSVR